MVQAASEALFPSAGAAASPRVVQNVMFFRGTNSVVTAEQLAAELLRAETQIADGTALRVDDID
jgi:hypothetical protein